MSHLGWCGQVGELPAECFVADTVSARCRAALVVHRPHRSYTLTPLPRTQLYMGSRLDRTTASSAAECQHKCRGYSEAGQMCAA